MTQRVGNLGFLYEIAVGRQKKASKKGKVRLVQREKLNTPLLGLEKSGATLAVFSNHFFTESPQAGLFRNWQAVKIPHHAPLFSYPSRTLDCCVRSQGKKGNSTEWVGADSQDREVGRIMRPFGLISNCFQISALSLLPFYFFFSPPLIPSALVLYFNAWEPFG